MTGALRFPQGVVVTPHHLASSAGVRILAAGGTAVDAAIAANLVLAVVTPYHCGPGGDLLALVWDGQAHGYVGVGRSPANASLEQARAALAAPVMPATGPHTVTVPGAVDGWFALLARFGRMSFGRLAAAAIDYAQDGFPVSERGARAIAAAAEQPMGIDWHRLYAGVQPGTVLRQPGLGALLDRLARNGPEVFYDGAVASSIAAAVRAYGGSLTPDDLAVHHGEWVSPLLGSFGGVDVMQLPPPTQGVTALQALAIIDGLDLPPDSAARTHLLIEATKQAIHDRSEHVADPGWMRTPTEELLAPAHIDGLRAAIDPRRAVAPAATSLVGGTAAIVAADSEGRIAIVMQSNFRGFGSGITVPEWGINLHDRGSSFVLRAEHPNAYGPAKRPLHTLAPMFAFREGRPWLAFGTMGGDGQIQTHVQVLTRMVVDGDDVGTAVDAPRWFVSPEDWWVGIEGRVGPRVLDDLAERGHRVTRVGAYESLMGHAQAVVVDDHGYIATSDRRTEGAAVGL